MNVLVELSFILRESNCEVQSTLAIPFAFAEFAPATPATMNPWPGQTELSPNPRSLLGLTLPLRSGCQFSKPASMMANVFPVAPPVVVPQASGASTSASETPPDCPWFHNPHWLPSTNSESLG